MTFSTRCPFRLRVAALFPVAVLVVLAADSAAAADSETEIDFNRDIRPLLSNRCIACHGPDEAERKADLRLDIAEGATTDLGGYAAVVPGDTEASELIWRITSDDRTEVMPPPGKGEPFSEAEVALIRRWIEQGGEYDRHWSYRKPDRPSLPEDPENDWSDHPVDQFIFRRLKSEGWEPSPRAERPALARRIALDLTGLPPSWEEVEHFLADTSPGAVSRYVDRQLAKPAFGERWARVWLDLARYADSAGYADDPPRTIWAFRDYVIRSMNENLPFDQFTIEQIAGDLLEDPDDDQIIATAFHRNTLTNNEGGTNDEEFRNVAVVDRVNTTMSVWMGTTMACAQCHTHKYDPLTHAEYFQLFDFFNQSADADRKDETPLHEVWTEELRERKAGLESEIERVKGVLDTPTPAIAEEREAWLQRWSSGFSWNPVAPGRLAGREAELASGDGGWIAAEPKAARDRYTLDFDLGKQRNQGEKPVTGLRLEVSPQQKSNFVLSRVTAEYRPAGGESSVPGRYVRIELPGKTKTLQLAEVEVFAGGENVAVGRPAMQSSVYAGATAANAVDGDTEGDYQAGSVFHSLHEDDPWIEIDLGEVLDLERIVVWNRTDGGDSIAKRIEGYRVRILDGDKKETFSAAPGGIPRPRKAVPLSGARELSFSLASASYEQEDFPASSVLSEKVDAKTGWAIAGGTGRDQELILVFDEPLDEHSGTLRVALDQASQHDDHLLRHFRVSLTREPALSEWAAVPETLRGLVLRRDSLDAAGKKKLERHFLAIAPSLADERKQLASLEKQLERVKPLTTVPVMRDLPEEKRRESHVHLRGSYLSHGEKVTAGVPEVFHDLPEEAPRNRLALARWLVDDENPLTPRVIANRMWEQLFGIGIVETSEEFGSQGELPSHPDLLDWLAVELRDGGWDRKAFLKLLVTSETYLQDSRVTGEMMSRDPYNRLLARGPRFRISAEMVRDQALEVAGLLSDKRYGPPVKPPQPSLGLKAAFGSKTDWTTSEGDDRYRRGLYTTWRRSSPYPSMATFDAPNREVCTVRRSRTNTPLQALVTLNDPVYVEAAQAWGRRAAARNGGVAERIRKQFRETLIREADDGEVSRLVRLFEEALAHYRADPDAAREMAENPRGPIPESFWKLEGGEESLENSTPEAREAARSARLEDARARLEDARARLAAWTVVGNVVLNLDEMFMKR